MDFGGFVAPTVLPGEYTVKIKVGDKVQENKIVMQRDPNSEMSMADMQVQYDAAMKLYNMHENLGKLVDSINTVQASLKENLAAIKNPKVKKLLEEYNGKLEELRSKCLATKQKSLFADEKKLREDITDVYAAICNQETPPSNLQIDRIQSLQQQLGEAQQLRVNINNQYQEKVKAAILKESMSTKPKVNRKDGE
jgi:hypothetical protein